jgi:hypothetical protein
VKNGEKKKKK